MVLYKIKKFNYAAFSFLLFLGAVCSLTVIACLWAYQYDNKYSFSGPAASYGRLKIDENTLKAYPAMILVDGWAYYGGRLLSPEDFQKESLLPDKYIYIGAYGGFEAGNPELSPHGSATYRLTIEIPQGPQSYTLELPEIFSSYHLYINDKLMTSMGNPDPKDYSPETLNRSVSFVAEEKIEIIIAVSDFSHLYSGMVYPPAFGLPDAVSRILSARFLFRAALCTSAFIIGFMSVLIGVLSRKEQPAVIYGLLCLFFVGYSAYPILKKFYSAYAPFYALENFSFCAMLLIIMLLQRKICQMKSKWSFVFPFIGALICIFSLIFHIFLLPKGNLMHMHLYSWTISFYEWITAGYLTVAAFFSLSRKHAGSVPIIAGLMVFDTAIVMDRLLPLYEPVITGWFLEIASFILIISIGVSIGKNMAEQYRKNAVLEERSKSMEKLFQMQRAYYPIIQEKIKEAKEARHDIRHHFVAISGFIEKRQYDRLKAYLDEYRYRVLEEEPVSYCENEIADILAHYYAGIAEKYDIKLDMLLGIDNEIKVTGTDLCALLSNLLENALEACRSQKEAAHFINLTARHSGNILAIRLENSSPEREAGLSGFMSSKERGRKGYGLESIKNIASRYNGVADFQYDKAAKAFISTIILETE